MREPVDAQGGHDDGAAVGKLDQRGDMTIQPLAVRQAAVRIVQGEVDDPPLALADLGRHGVEALGQARDLVVALNGHLGVFAALQPAGRLLQRRQRTGYAARQAPAADDQQDHAQHPGADDHRQQRLVGGHGAGDRILQHQNHGRVRGDGAQRLGQGDGRPFSGVQAPRHAARLERGVDEAGHGALLHGVGRLAAVTPYAVGPARQHRGVERDGRELLEGAHLGVIKLVGEHQPADRDRRQHRLGHHLIGRVADDQDAGGRIVTA